MVQSTNQRVGLGGLDEVRRGLASVAAEAQQSGNTIRQVLLQATGHAQQFGQGIEQTGASARATRYAIQNLSFQINDVATSLASGISPFRTFTQQAGQFVQLFQQGGGVGAVIGGFASRLTALITPTRLAVASVAALAAGIAALAIRVENSEVSAQKFDVQLKAIGNTSGVTGKDLEAAAHRLGDVGLSAAEARTKLQEFLNTGGDARFAESTVRTAENLSAVLGKSVGESFSSAVGTGSVEALQGIARRLRIPVDEASKNIFADFREQSRKLNLEIEDQVIRLNRAVGETRRRAQQQIRDLTRELGTERSFPGQEDPTARKEILVQATRQEEELRRQSQFAINDMLRQAAIQRNEENRKALEAYNKDIEDKANKAGEAERLRLAITQKVTGAEAAMLGPVGTAVQHLRVEWDQFIDSLSKSLRIAEAINALESFFITIKKLQSDTGIPGVVAAIAAALPIIAALTKVLQIVALTPVGRAITAISVALALLIENWDSVKPFFVGIINWLNGINDAANAASASIAHLFGGLTPEEKNLSEAIDRANKLTGSTGPGGAFAPIPAGASGGLFLGPGTGTSDSILARVSNGEFLVNAAATRMNLPLLQAINSMSRPIQGGRSGFAAGGLVTAAATGMDRASFTLVIEGQRYDGLSAPVKTAKNMLQYARTSSLMSAGKAPSWKGTG